ncbi:MAG: CheY-like chemotaxis protein [Saprospiraceae bacterium]|jgi:CheY-like chemotaxis protein
MKSILWIEDNAGILEDFIEYLEMEEYIVLSANNDRDGLEIARKMMPDLIICDVLMPEMSGYEVLRLLKGDVKTYQIPFIVSTSMSEVIDKATRLLFQ